MLLQLNEPLPAEATDLIVETAPWAAEFEPPVLPPDVAVARDDAETIRSPLLRSGRRRNIGERERCGGRAADLRASAGRRSSSNYFRSSAGCACPGSLRTAAPEPEDEGDYDDSDFDPDVAAIFTEEATELLETADQSLSSWIRDRANSALVFELKRVVHTLKGGARMAGIRAMGDLSHELETLMGLVETGQVPAEQKVFEALQASLDELHRMRDMVAGGERCKPARELMRRIRALCSGEAEAAPAPAAPTPRARIDSGRSDHSSRA